MEMRSLRAFAAGAFLATLLVGVAAFAGAGEAEGEASGKAGKAGRAAVKLPNPAAVLEAAVKSLAKAKGYRAAVEIQGGFSEKEDHLVTQPVVKESYAGEVYGAMMHCPEVKAFRMPKKGVAYIDGQWRGILSDPKTVRLERLFTFPEVILGRALKHAPRGSRWLLDSLDAAASGGSEGGAGPAEEKEAGPIAPAGEPRSGKTVVVKKGDREAPLKAAQPRFLRVDAPPEEALTHLIEVQNSNCFGGG